MARKKQDSTKTIYLAAWGEAYKSAFPVAAYQDKAVIEKILKDRGYKYNEKRDGWFNDKKKTYCRVIGVPVDVENPGRI